MRCYEKSSFFMHNPCSHFLFHPYLYLTCSSDTVSVRAQSLPYVTNKMFWTIYSLSLSHERRDRGGYNNCAHSVFSIHFSANGTSVYMASTYSVIMLRISLRMPNHILLVSLLDRRHLFQQVQEHIQQVDTQK